MDLTCDVENCDRPIWYLYYCESHYKRNIKWGNPIIERLCFDCGLKAVDPQVIHNHFYCSDCYSLIINFGHLLTLTSGQLSNHKLRRGKAITMLIQQNFKCALCQENTTDWRIDHDHSCCPGIKGISCGKCIRGLLCHTCNLIVGWNEKHPHLRVAIDEYLSKPRVSA